MALPHGATGLSVVCDCGIFLIILTFYFYRYHKTLKSFSKFYHRHSELIVKYNIGVKTLLGQGKSEPIFYCELVYKFKRVVGKPNFSDQLKILSNVIKKVDIGHK